jgi:hypothetical protein
MKRLQSRKEGHQPTHFCYRSICCLAAFKGVPSTPEKAVNASSVKRMT